MQVSCYRGKDAVGAAKKDPKQIYQDLEVEGMAVKAVRRNAV